VKAREWGKLATRHLVPVLAERIDRPLTVRATWIVVGDVGLLTHAIGYAQPKHSTRQITTYATALLAYTGQRATGRSARCGWRENPRPLRTPDHSIYTEIPEGDSDLTDAAMKVLTRRTVDDALAHFERWVDYETCRAPSRRACARASSRRRC
jgi:hypothetical protein